MKRFTIGSSYDPDDTDATCPTWHVRDNHDGRLVGRVSDVFTARALAGALNELEAELVAEGPQDPDLLRRLADIEAHDAWEADDSDSIDRRLRLMDLAALDSDAREEAARDWAEHWDGAA